jgi:hypothetical protein
VSVQNPWTKHRQSFWLEQAGNPSLALWLRTSALAYGVHRLNGHAPFEPGDLARALAVLNEATGEMRQPSAAQVSRAIATAAKYGFLAAESCARCLVVPLHAIDGGVRGKPYEVCREHTRCRGVCLSESKTGLDVDTESQRTALSESNDDALTSTNLVVLYDSSLPHPGHRRQLGASPEVDHVASAAAGLPR